MLIDYPRIWNRRPARSDALRTPLRISPSRAHLFARGGSRLFYQLNYAGFAAKVTSCASTMVLEHIAISHNGGSILIFHGFGLMRVSSEQMH
jgi:hypothetical protein